ncbi:MAG TPA: tetratricopeptide repeat protein [Candidatus Limnocylindria bacterium]|jgi:tetratricopeptide (TPR) repeat protein|nr:tetratricopeptide repeat protein [Candidatus Limnocylindria bacterium]
MTQHRMSRFGKLEFEMPGEQRSSETVGTHANHFLEEARQLFFRAEFEPALRSYARALEYNPATPEPWVGQVRVLIELGEFHEARGWAEKGLERFPREAELLAAQAVAVARLGDVEAALAFSDASMEADGNVPYLWIARADVLLARQESTSAYCLARAKALAPRDWSVCWVGGRVLLYWNKLAEALKMAQEAISLDAGELSAWLLAAECQLELGLVGAAQLSCRQAVALGPNHPSAASLLERSSHVGWGERLAGWWRRNLRKGTPR